MFSCAARRIASSCWIWGSANRGCGRLRLPLTRRASARHIAMCIQLLEERVDHLLFVNPPGVVTMKPPAPPELVVPETAFSRVPPPPEGTEIASPFPPQPGKRVFQRGMRSLTWDASDPNADTLRYDLFFRTEGDQDWKPLVQGMIEEYFAWDSTRMPDGRYRIKIQASDSPSNLPGTEKKGERMSRIGIVLAATVAVASLAFASVRFAHAPSGASWRAWAATTPGSPARL